MGPMLDHGRLFVRTKDGLLHEFTGIKEVHFEAREPEPRKEGITITASPNDPDYVIVEDHATGDRKIIRYYREECHSSDFYDAALYALRKYCENNFNMKVVCVNCDGHNRYLYIPGKVYEIKNGQMIGPNGRRYGCYTSLNELNNNSVLGLHCQFIEFKGEA